MYDFHMIVPNSLKNIEEDGKVTGFEFGIRLAYYSSTWLSTVSPMEISVDGEQIPHSDMTFTLCGKSYDMEKLADESNERWEFGDIAWLKVKKPGGLKKGTHVVDYRQHINLSFITGGLYGHTCKEMELA